MGGVMAPAESGVQPFAQFALRREQYVAPLTRGAVAHQRLRQVALASAGC